MSSSGWPTTIKGVLTFCTIAVPVDVEYPHSTLVTHALFGNAYDLVVVFAEGNPLDGRGELPTE